MKTQYLIPLVVTLSACAPMQYKNAEGVLAPERTVLECEYEAKKAVGGATDANPLAGAYGGLHALLTNSRLRAQGIETDCMKLRGYTLQQ
jgi:hypothetical protein